MKNHFMKNAWLILLLFISLSASGQNLDELMKQGKDLVELNKPEQALEIYTRAIRLFPTEAAPFFERGRIKFLQENSPQNGVGILYSFLKTGHFWPG